MDLRSSQYKLASGQSASHQSSFEAVGDAAAAAAAYTLAAAAAAAEYIVQ